MFGSTNDAFVAKVVRYALNFFAEKATSFLPALQIFVFFAGCLFTFPRFVGLPRPLFFTIEETDQEFSRVIKIRECFDKFFPLKKFGI